MNIKSLGVNSCTECPFSVFSDEIGGFECVNPKYSIEDVHYEVMNEKIHKDCGLQRSAIMVKLSDDARRRFEEKNIGTGKTECDSLDGEPGTEIGE